MFLRKSFQEFLILHSDAEPVLPLGHAQPSQRSEDRETAPPRDQVIDWRWLEGDLPEPTFKK